jgi:hypothetical protein
MLRTRKVKSARQRWEETRHTIVGGSGWRRRVPGEGVVEAERMKGGRRGAHRNLRATCGTARLGGRCGVKRAGSKIFTPRVARVRNFASPRILSFLIFALHFIILRWLLVGPILCWPRLALSVLVLLLHGSGHSLFNSIPIILLK